MCESKLFPRLNYCWIDAVAEENGRIFIIEFKLNGTAEDAMDQIRDMQKYQNSEKPITLVGAAFDQTTRNMESWLIEEL